MRNRRFGTGMSLLGLLAVPFVQGCTTTRPIVDPSTGQVVGYREEIDGPKTLDVMSRIMLGLVPFGKDVDAARNVVRYAQGLNTASQLMQSQQQNQQPVYASGNQTGAVFLRDQPVVQRVLTEPRIDVKGRIAFVPSLVVFSAEYPRDWGPDYVKSSVWSFDDEEISRKQRGVVRMEYAGKHDLELRVLTSDDKEYRTAVELIALSMPKDGK